MNTEQKAKAYDEAIEGIQEILSSGQDSIKMSRLKLRLQGIFPELKKSEDEDEKIKQALIKLVTNHASMDLFIEYDIHLDEALAWLEKQGEQKPVEWHREDEQNLNACLGYIPDEFLRKWLTDVIHTKYDKPTDKKMDDR